MSVHAGIISRDNLTTTLGSVPVGMVSEYSAGHAASWCCLSNDQECRIELGNDQCVVSTWQSHLICHRPIDLVRDSGW